MLSHLSHAPKNMTQQTQLELNRFLENSKQIQTDIQTLLTDPFMLSTQGEQLLLLQDKHKSLCIQLADLFIKWVSANYGQNEITEVRLMHPNATANKEKIKIELLESQIDFFQKNYLDRLSQQLKQSQSEQLKKEISEALKSDEEMSNQSIDEDQSDAGDQ